MVQNSKLVCLPKLQESRNLAGNRRKMRIARYVIILQSPSIGIHLLFMELLELTVFLQVFFR